MPDPLISKPTNPKPIAASRDVQIAGREAAIKRKLDKSNMANQRTALASINKKTGGTKKYATKEIAGADKGFTKSDYGVGLGAAIPYQITDGSGSVTKEREKLRQIEAKPKAKPKGHSSYKVRRGDTLSGIAKKHGTTVDAIWDYNLKNRSKKTQATLKKRGKNLIFRGGTFYIPK